MSIAESLAEQKIMSHIVDDITENLKNTALVHYGFVSPGGTNDCKDLFCCNSKAYKFKDFGFEKDENLGWTMKYPLRYNHIVDLISEQFTYAMAQNVARSTLVNVSIDKDENSYYHEKKLMHCLNYDEQSEHVVLYPIQSNFNNTLNTERFVEKLIQKKLPNVHLQPFIIHDEYGSLDRVFHLVSNSKHYGSLCYYMSASFNMNQQTVEFAMHLVYKKQLQKEESLC